MNISDKPKDFWKYLFEAGSIAVIGAKNAVGTWGQDAMRAALDSAKFKAGRQAYPVNPNEPEILGVKAYKTILDIPGPVELAVIVVPAPVAPQVFRQCAEKGVKMAVVITAGFAEVDAGGARLEAEMKETARAAGMRFTGPNCNGHADLHTHVASISSASNIPAGRMALLSQSGTLGASIMQIAAGRGIGLSKFVSTGNEADLRMEDYLEYLGADPNTGVIALYIEGLREARRFYDLAKEITRKKPIVAMKSGATAAAAKAARSHTGTLAGSDVIYSAAFKQAGVIRVEDEEALCDTVIAFNTLPLPRGNRIAILTIGGGFGVVTAEDCEKEGMEIAALAPETLQKLAAVLPPRWTPGNPVDMVGVRSGDSNDRTGAKCLQALMEDPNVDSVISLLVPMIYPPGPAVNYSEEKIREIRARNDAYQADLCAQIKKYGKPLVYIRRMNVYYGSEGSLPKATTEQLIPEYSHPRRAARALRYLAEYRRHIEG